ncbi:MAG: DUF5615 family PIN-like protein [Planctomycetota bacterium]|nr:DUF5615 family PIN-like protein [Planctomycetota bacterium]
MKFLVDENLGRGLQHALARERPGLLVLRVGDRNAPPPGTLDPALLLWCEQHGFVLISGDRRTLPRHLRDHLNTGHHVPGIVWLRSTASYESIIESLLIVAEAAHEEDLADQITMVPL